MPNWIRILFLKYLPIFLFMRRPKKTRLRWMMEIPGTSRKIPPGPPPNVMNSSGAGLMGASTMPDGGPGLHGLSPPGYPQVSTQRVSILDALGANICKFCKLTQFRLQEIRSSLLYKTANPAKFSPKLSWIGCAIQQAISKRLPGFSFHFNILIHFFDYVTIKTHACAFQPLNISAVCSAPS